MLKLEDPVVDGIGATGSGAGLARVQISTSPAQLMIDSSAARREMGLLNTTELAFDRADYAKQRGAKGIAATVSAGARMAKPYTGENVIARLAFERALRDLSDMQFQLAFIPRTPPQITYIPGEMQIDFVI